MTPLTEMAATGEQNLHGPPAASPKGSIEAAAPRNWPWLVTLWAIVTAYNLFKPYHIDDTVHLEIARWISAHPFRPMSGLLN